ncbi:MAG: hypothetical protein LIO53_02780 [Oscillospiraceae bacterium]|nr:hypothetical protein [Oscillospiraceae bacterium]
MYPTDTEKIRQNLIDAGCDRDTISDFLKFGKNEINQKMILLYNHRKKLLEDFHSLQKEIDCLDYLIYQTEKSGGEQQ